MHSVVPLGGSHARLIGVVTVAGNGCSGFYTDPGTLPDADALADDLRAAMDDPLALLA